MSDSSWFFIVVEGLVSDPVEIGQQGYYCQRPLLGQAIAAALAEAVQEPNCLREVAISYVAVVNEDEMEGELYETTTEGLIESDDLYVRPLDEGREFAIPTGVVFSAWQPEGVQRESIQAGLQAEDHEDGFVVEALVPGNQLEEVLLATIQALPTIDSLTTVLLDHYDSVEALSEDGLNENMLRCLTKDCSNLSDVQQEIEAGRERLLHNGHVDIGFNSHESESTVWLTEHKTVHFVTADRELRDRIKQTLLDKGIPELAELPSFATTFSHFHYRPAESDNTDALVTWLMDQGWEEAPVED